MMEVFDKNGNKIKLQEIENTGWEPLFGADNYAIAGKIVNGIATIRLNAVSLTPTSISGATKIVDLPDRYRCSRVVNFIATRDTKDPTIVVGYVQNNAMFMHFNKSGSATYYGLITYPVE